MINGVPSAAFSMSLIPPMGHSNPQLRDALKKLSAAKYGRPRAQVEKEIFARLGAGDVAKRAKLEALKKAQQDRIDKVSIQGQAAVPLNSATPSFLDEWIAKRQQIAAPVINNNQPVIENVLNPAIEDKRELNVLERGSNDEVSIKLR